MIAGPLFFSTLLGVSGNRLSGPVPGLRRFANAARYQWLDASGEVGTAGSYAFLDSRGSVITTYEGLRRQAVALHVHDTDADGVTWVPAHAAVEAGDIVEWWQAQDCWSRYLVTAVQPGPRGRAPRTDFSIRWMTYAGTGCTGPIPSDAVARIELRPPPITSPDITSPVRHGPYLLRPERWEGHIEPWGPVATPAGARSHDASLEWPSHDPAVVRQHPLWREPDLPEGLTLSRASASNGGGTADTGAYFVYVAGDYVEPDGSEALQTTVTLVNSLPEGVYGATPQSAGEWGAESADIYELRVIDGHAALLWYAPGGAPRERTVVRIFDRETSIEYAVTALHPSVNDLETTIAIARSLYR